MKMKTPKFTIIVGNDGNNIIEYNDIVLFAEKMTRSNDGTNDGVTFTGVAYRNLKDPVYTLTELGCSSIQVNEFRLDISAPQRIRDYELFCSDYDILNKLKKIMKIPIGLDESIESFVFVEMLHSTGE